MSIGMLKGLQQLLEVCLDLEARSELDVVITSWSSLFQNCCKSDVYEIEPPNDPNGPCHPTRFNCWIAMYM